MHFKLRKLIKQPTINLSAMEKLTLNFLKQFQLKTIKNGCERFLKKMIGYKCSSSSIQAMIFEGKVHVNSNQGSLHGSLIRKILTIKP